MEEKYQLLNKKNVNLYADGSPIVISVIAISKEIVTGNIIGQVKFRNICEKTINAIVFDAKAFDVLGSELTDVEGIQLLDLSVRKNEFFGDKYPIRFSNNKTRTLSVEIQGVVFEDGEIWKTDNANWYSIESEKLFGEEDKCSVENEKFIEKEIEEDYEESEQEQEKNIIKATPQEQKYEFMSSKGMKIGRLIGRIVTGVEIIDDRVKILSIPQKYNEVTGFTISDIEEICCKKAISFVGIIRTIIFALLAFVLSPITILFAVFLIIWIDLNDKIVIALKNGKRVIIYSNYRKDTKCFLQDVKKYGFDIDLKKKISMKSIFLMLILVMVGTMIYLKCMYSMGEARYEKGEYVEAITYFEKANGYKNSDDMIMDCKCMYLSEYEYDEIAEKYMQELASSSYFGTTDIQEYKNRFCDWAVNILTSDGDREIKATSGLRIYLFVEGSIDGAVADATCTVTSSNGYSEHFIFKRDRNTGITQGKHTLVCSSDKFKVGDVVTVTLYINSDMLITKEFKVVPNI